MIESQNIEWKESWRDEYLKWICGFANSQGGILEVGKNDRGVVIGVENYKKLLEDLPNKIRNAMGIVADINLKKTSDNIYYIIINIKAHPYPISYKGKYYYRSGSTLQELSGAALDEFMLKKQGKTWDSVPVPYVVLEDFESDAFKIFRKKATASMRLSEEDLKLSDELLVENLMLKENKYLKRAAILLFHQKPEKWVLGSHIKVGYFENDADLIYQDEIHGSILSQPDKIVDLVYTKYLKAIISYDGIQRIETYPIPKSAFREAILNAIVHKDYSTGNPIQISIYEDRIYIANDGRLPENWTVNELLSKHKSKPFNPLLANAFFRSGMIEAWGRGIEKINSECENAGIPKPEFIISPTDIMVLFKTKKVGTKVGIKVGTNIQDNINRYLSKNQIRILELVTLNPRITVKNIAEEIGISERKTQANIKKLKELKCIERVGANKNGYWVIIEKGRNKII